MSNPAESKKIFLVTGVLAILLIGIFVIRWQRQKSLSQDGKTGEVTTAKKTPTPTFEPVTGVYYALPSQKSVKAGGKVSVNVAFVAEGKKLDGSDVILKFDPNFLVADKSLVFGDYFSNYPRKEVDNSKGIIKVTGFTPKKADPITVLTSLFTVTFQAKKTGTTKITFDFVKWATSTTTLVEKGTSKNLLGTANEAVLTITQ